MCSNRFIPFCIYSRPKCVSAVSIRSGPCTSSPQFACPHPDCHQPTLESVHTFFCELIDMQNATRFHQYYFPSCCGIKVFFPPNGEYSIKKKTKQSKNF